MDEALYYLMEAQNYIDSFVDISVADSFFEETEEAKEANENNEKAKGGAVAALKKAFRAMIEAIKNIISNISDFFQTRALSAEERQRYAEFKKMIKEDPEFAKQKVTIQDWREYEKAYEEALKALEEEAKKPNPRDEFVDAVIKKLSDEISALAGQGKDAAGRAAMSVTLSTAVDIADQNVTCAKTINYALQHELISLQDIEKSLGAEEAAKFEKQIKAAAKNGFLHRARVRIFKHKEQTFEAIIRKQFKNLMAFTNIKNGKVADGKSVVDSQSLARGVVKNKKLVVDTVGGKDKAMEISKNLATSAAKAKIAQMKAADKAKKTKKEYEDLKTFFGVGGKKK